MKKIVTMPRLVVISGVLAAIAWQAPSLVTLGMLLIVPGLILAASPTVFVYLLAALVIRKALPATLGRWATPASLALAILLGWVVNQPGRWYEMQRFRSAQLPEVFPADKLALDGDVSLEWDSRLRRITRPEECEYICAALLDTPGVESVTIGPEDTRQRLRLVTTASPEAGVYPQDPAEILAVIGRVDATNTFDQRQVRRDALNAAWIVRLGAGETITSEAASSTTTADWTIRHTIQPSRDEPRVDRLEVFDRSGEIRMRRSLVRYRVPSMFLHFNLTGPFELPRFAYAQQGVSTAGRYVEFDAAAELLRHITIVRPVIPENAPEALRAAVVTALDDPTATPKQLAVAEQWLTQMDSKDERANEIALIQRVAEDPRLRGSTPVLRELYERSAPVEFRRAYVARIVDPETSPEDRDYCARVLARMPVGTFAQPTADEITIWEDPLLRREAAPFLERLADRGEQGVQPLIAALQEAVAIKQWHERRPLVREIRRGFTRLGPTASPALPLVVSLVTQSPSPVLQSANEGFEWRKTLVLMGLPVAEVPLPASFKAERIAREREKLEKAAADYDPDHRSGYNY